MNDNSISVFPYLRLLRFTWKHGQQTVLQVGSGLTILHGKTQAERTVLLRLIKYALGGNAERIDEDTMRASDEVELEFLANGQQARSVRDCQHTTARFTVFDEGGKHDFTVRDMSVYLLDQLALPVVFMSRTRQGKTLDVSLSFNDLARAIFIDRDISYSAILSEMTPEPRQQTTKVMMGLTTREIANAENQLHSIENERVQLEQRVEAIRSFLTHLDVPTLPEIEERNANLNAVLKEHQDAEDSLRAQVRRASSTDARELFTRSYDELLAEFQDTRRVLESNTSQILDLEHQVKAKNELRTVLAAEVRKIQRQLASQHVVSTYTFSLCPRCMQEITTEMREHEEVGNCMLCGRPFERRTVDLRPWEKTMQDVNQAIQEVNDLLDAYEKRIHELGKTNAKIEDRVQYLAQVLERATAEYVSPLIEQLTLSVEERTSIERALGQLEHERRQREYALQLEQELPDVESRLEQANRQLEDLRHGLGSEVAKRNAFLTHFKHFLESVSLDRQVESVSWNEDEDLPEINGQPYKKAVSGPDLALTVLAFHYGLAAMSVGQPHVETSFPKLLVIDEPEQQKMGKERYRQVMKLFADLAIQHADLLQIVIATETSDVPSELEEYAFSL
jgi:hypothetical protein